MPDYNADGSLGEDFYINRLRARYSFLFPTNCTKEELKHIFSHIDPLEPFCDGLFVSPKNYAKPTFLGILLKNQKYIDLKMYDLQYLTEVWLGKYEDTPSLSHIRDKHMAVSFSSRDLPNRSREDVLLFLLENQMRGVGDTRWLFYQGNPVDLKTNFPSLVSKMKDSNSPLIYIPPFFGERVTGVFGSQSPSTSQIGSYFG